MGEDRADAHSVGRGGDRLTIAEAATLLGVHKNTIRNRIKQGTYKVDKVITERGETYLIERKSLLANLTTNALSSDSQRLVNPAPMEFVQELLRPFVSELGDIRQELGAERVRRQIAEERAAALEAELQELRDARETPVKTPVSEASPHPGEPPPDAPADSQEAAEPPRDRTNRLQLELLETRQLLEDERSRPRSWWRRLFDG